jgi:hypothetical protein
MPASGTLLAGETILMADEDAREIHPLILGDPLAPEPGDFRPQVVYTEEQSDTEVPDPKDLSAAEPAESLASKTQEPLAKIAPVEKVSMPPKASKPGSQTSSPETKAG